MLTDKLRSGAQGRIFKVIFWIIILSFVLTGVGSYLLPKSNPEVVKVGDISISVQELNNSYNQTVNRVDPNLLNNKDYVKQLKQSVLDQLVNNAALSQAIYDLDIRISDDQIKDAIRANPAFQKDGVFNNDQYLAVLRNNGLSTNYYAEQIRAQLMNDALTTRLINATSIPLEYELSQIQLLLSEQRTVDIYTLKDNNTLANNIKVTDDEAKSFYNRNQNLFMDSAKAKINYVLLSLNEVKSKLNPTEQELKALYDMHAQDFKTPSKFDLLHLYVPKDSKDYEANVKAITDAIAKGVSFDDLRKYSNELQYEYKNVSIDPKQQMFVNQAINQLTKKGEYTTVQADDGTHFFYAKDYTAEQIKPLNEVKDELLNIMAKDEFSKKVSSLSDITYENPDSLDPAAKALNLKVQDSGLINADDKNLPYPLNDPNVLKEAFNPDSASNGVNSNVITLQDGNAVVINVYSYTPAVQKDFDKVKDIVINSVKKTKLEAIEQDTLSNLGKYIENDVNVSDKDMQNFDVQKNIKFSRTQNVDNKLLEKIFAINKMPKNGYTIGKYNNKTALVVLKEVMYDDKANTLQIATPVIVNYKQQQNSTDLINKAKEIVKIKYNDAALKQYLDTNEDQA